MKLQEDNHPEGNSYLDCSRCQELVTKEARARWNCGLLKPSERIGPGFPAPADWGESSEICPGYLVTLPQVIETARARVHWEKGLLKERYEGQNLPGVLFDCIEILSGAVSDVESFATRSARDGNS